MEKDADADEIAVTIRDGEDSRRAVFSPLFTAISNVMLSAKKKRLEPEDLLHLQPSDDVLKCAEVLQREWMREVARVAEAKSQDKSKKSPSSPSLARAVWPLIKQLWRVAFLFYIFAITLSFAGPLILSLSIRVIESTQMCALRERELTYLNATSLVGAVEEAEIGLGLGLGTDAEVTLPREILAAPPPISQECRDSNQIHLGYIYAAIMLTTKIIEALCQSWHQHLMTRVALRTRAGVIGAIYRKCLWLSGMQGEDSSIGRIQTLMANDAQFFLQFAPMFNNLFIAPIQILVAFIWLAVIIGPSFLAGLGVMFISVPMQGCVIKGYFKHQIRRLKFVDERVKLTNEMVQGMRVIKMYAWERTTMGKIEEIRKQELACVRSQRFLSATLSIFMTAQPLLVTVVTFSVYGGTGNPLRASIVMPALALLALLRLPLAFLPMVFMQLANLKVALMRISKFLTNDELPADVKQRSIAAGREAAAADAKMISDHPVSPPATQPTSTPIDNVARTPSFDGVCATTESAACAPGMADEVSITGSFVWPQPEVPAGKGKGGKGAKGGKGGKGGKGRKSKEEEVKKPPRPPTLQNLAVSFPKGQLTMIAGAVGSGKSSLLCALLGELNPAKESTPNESTPKESDPTEADATAKAGAQVQLAGRAGYFAQTAFILNDTVRGNILLGAPMDDERYQRTLRACALLPDLKILPGGDMTQIGEKGINLSGGQKARVALARACYAGAPTLLLDDPLSAVDAHVGKHVFREVLGPRGLLAGSTRILVTHQTQFLPLADHIVVLDQGRVLAQGTFSELRSSGADLSSIASLSSEEADAVDIGRLLGDDAEASDAAAVAQSALKPAEGTTLVQAEERATGSISWAMYMAYLRAMGGPLFGVLFVAGVMWERSVLVATDYWLTMWMDPTSSALGKFTPEQSSLHFWIPIYFAGVCVGALSVYLRSCFMGIAMGLRAARVIYQRLAGSVLSAPMLFFETTPSGRILNRFTSDTEQMDFGLLMQISQWTNCVSSVMGGVVLICVVNPWFLCGLPVFIGIYTFAYNLSSTATRDLQRLEAVSRSPIFTQFSETLNGLSTIRAFGATARFEAQSTELVAMNTRCLFNQDLANQWISLRLDFCSAMIAAMTVLLPTVTIHFGESLSTSPAAFGLCITYALELSAFLKFGTKMILEIQKGMAAVERILEYADHVSPEKTGGHPLPALPWPTSGRIVANHLCVRYRPELPLALDGVCCTIEPRAKVGIVGRTGSGKTTFVSALWRLVEPTCGADGTGGTALEIDGIDISALELKQLRSRLAIIVQDPVLFNDTLKYNLDPFGEHTDNELREVVGHAQLEGVVAKLDKGLLSPVGEAGANFSAGQRQLICLARAMLRKSKIVVLDEATASIDNETDAILQACIRQVFADATVLTIAHRLHTIMDSSQILLFDKGELKENDSPAQLLADADSLFSQLVADTGSAAAHLRQLAAEGATA